MDQDGMVTIPEMGTPNFKVRWEELCTRAVLWYHDVSSFHDSKTLGRHKETVVCYVILCVAIHSKAFQDRLITCSMFKIVQVCSMFDVKTKEKIRNLLSDQGIYRE